MKQTSACQLYVLLTAVTFSLFSSFLFIQTAAAQVLPFTTELDGYAWSSNIGWISLNCKTGGVGATDICSTSNYKVTLNQDRTVSGYAWSSNIGWVKFNSLSAFPTGAGTNAVSAQVVGTYPNLSFEGWARACAGTLPGDCSDMTSRADGWDGWISLRGTNYQVNTDVNGMSANSYAWGSTVVGWIDMFSQVIWHKPEADLAMANCTIPDGASTCLASTSWSIRNASNGESVRNVTTNDVFSTAATGNGEMNELTLGDNTIVARDGTAILRSVTARGNCIPPATDSNGVTCAVPPPTITLTTNKSLVRAGDTVSVSWTISPEPLASGSCTLSGPGLSGAVTTSGTRTSVALKSKSQFSVTCVGSYGSVTANDTVEVIATQQEV